MSDTQSRRYLSTLSVMACTAALLSAAGTASAEAGPAPGRCGSTATTSSGVYTQSGGTVIVYGVEYESTSADQNAVLVTGGSFGLLGSTVLKSGDASSHDASSFTGDNAAVLATAGATVTVANSSISTAGYGANGVFAYGSGATVAVTGCSITTTGDNSHGADVTFGGTAVLSDVSIRTSGQYDPAVATDMGGGTVTVNGGTGTATGNTSTSLYSTGTITVDDAVYSSAQWYGAMMDGSNAIVLHDTRLTGDVGGFMLWNTQGAITGTGTVLLDGGSLTAIGGNAFNAQTSRSIFTVEGGARVTQTGALLNSVTGSDATLIAEGERLSGEIYADSTSTAAARFSRGSRYSGVVVNAAVQLSSDSVWSVAGDSTISTLTDALQHGRIANIVGNGHTVRYNAADNAALGDRTYALPGGGYLEPAS